MISKIKSFLFENKTAKQTVAKNTVWLIIGNIVSRLIKALIIIYAARILLPQSWGAFNYALSIAGFFTIFADLGINSVITRESSKNLENQEKYFATAMFIKIIASFFTIIALLVFYPFIGPFVTSSQKDFLLISELIPLAAVIAIVDTLRDFAASLSRAWEKMEIESLVQILTNIAIVIAGYIALKIIPSARSLALGYAFGTTIGMIAGFIPYRRYFKNIASKFSFNLIKTMLSAGWPMATIGLMSTIMLNTDTLMIAWLKDVNSVGLYSAGLRIVYLVYIIPGIIASSIFPQLAKSQQNKERLSTILNRAFNILLFLAVPMTIGGVILAKKIILVLFGSQYEAGVLSFALLCLTYVPVFLIASFGNAIFAINQEKKLFGYALLGVFGNLILDIIFIPIWGIAGSALATVINQTIGILYLTFLTKKYIPLKTDIKNLFKILAGSLIMGVFVWMSLIAKANLFVSIFVGVVSYLAVLFALKEKEFLEGLALIKNFFAPKAKN